MGDVGRYCREPIRSNQRIQGSAAVAAYGCLYPRRSRRKVRRHSVETVAVAVRVGSHIEVRRCGVSICGALVVRPVHGPHILSRSASQAVERLAEIATKEVNLSQSMHVAPEVLTSDVSRRARRRIRLVAVRASEHAKPPGHQEAAVGQRQLMAGCGCPLHRFHRRIADRQPAPSTTAM